MIFKKVKKKDFEIVRFVPPCKLQFNGPFVLAPFCPLRCNSDAHPDRPRRKALIMNL